MGRQQLEGAAHEFVPGYEKELQHMIDRRLRVLSPEEAVRVRASESTQHCSVYEDVAGSQKGWQEEIQTGTAGVQGAQRVGYRV